MKKGLLVIGVSIPIFLIVTFLTSQEELAVDGPGAYGWPLRFLMQTPHRDFLIEEYLFLNFFLDVLFSIICSFLIIFLLNIIKKKATRN